MADKKKKNVGALSTETAAAKLTNKMSSFSVSTGTLGRSAFSTEKANLSQPLMKQQQQPGKSLQQPRKSLQQPPSQQKPLQQPSDIKKRKPLQQLQQQQQIPQGKPSQQDQRRPPPQKKPQQQHEPPRKTLQPQLHQKTVHNQQPLSQRKSQQPDMVPPRAQRNDVLNESARQTLDSINRRLAAVEGTQRGIGETLKQLKDVTSSIDERQKKTERKVTEIYNILKNLMAAQSSAARTRPEFLPFKTTADIVAFDHLDDDQFDALVHYLRYLGGANETDAAAIYFKACFKFGEDLFRHVTWHGSKSDNQILALKDTRFALACTEAMPIIKEILRKPNKVEIATAMTKALKSSKEAYRRERKRVAPPAEQTPPVRRQRQNYPPQNNAAENSDAENDALFEGEQQPNDKDQRIEPFGDTQVIEEIVGEEGERVEEGETEGEGEEGEEVDEEVAEEEDEDYEQEEEEGELEEQKSYVGDSNSQSINFNQLDFELPEDEFPE
ncbi:glutamic acid-rich protein-like [Nasonia vitripennis]|uniref:DUF4806 domain-containing protein n=1 Tax=Nasonia vitripennis TaxID=7425 RepID=A0A7M7QFL4_NASVI|nr:glutamic acid-rich protein-like [Nasonia vitripennis]XP_031781508.1 glutamic acid-rich protein-like [Nasonia vitripennis]XP_031784714.1 glutamic acid-rich protein-like [Nasonia vitripennis]